MNYCLWIKYSDSDSWHTACGHLQGIKVRPNQKRCYCGKLIQREIIDKEDPKSVAFKKIIGE